MFKRLSDIGRRIYHFIESAIKGGIDRGSVFEAIKSVFRGYREEDFVKDFRALSKTVANWIEVEGFPEDYPLNPDLFEPTRLPTDRPYLVTVRGRLINERTGETGIVRYTLGFDHVPSRREIMESALEAFNQRSRTGETNWRFDYDGIERLMRGF